MASNDPEKSRQFALYIVQKLRAAGHQALWAGGCVRDELRHIVPEDYDVATSATPDEIRNLFGKKRTLAIGAAFGVIVVLGPKGAKQIDVATFRVDVKYSDGRRPDSVKFSSPEEDAQRRDYTINGLFYDPIEEKVIDYVGGKEDLQRKVIRAIGDPHQRIAEDKLRMLRAIRFATTLDFSMDPKTYDVIVRHAKEIKVVSAERIVVELRKMLTHSNRAIALRMMQEAGLLEIILPEIKPLFQAEEGKTQNSIWIETLTVLTHLHEPSFPVALAALFRCLQHPESTNIALASQICQAWKISNEETQLTNWLLAYEMKIRHADDLTWPELQEVLIHKDIAELLKLSEAIAQAEGRSTFQIDYCRKKLQLPRDELNPAPLLSGKDLIDLKIPQGRVYRSLLRSVRAAQLEKKVNSVQEALDLARKLWEEKDFE